MNDPMLPTDVADARGRRLAIVAIRNLQIPTSMARLAWPLVAESARGACERDHTPGANQTTSSTNKKRPQRGDRDHAEAAQPWRLLLPTLAGSIGSTSQGTRGSKSRSLGMKVPALMSRSFRIGPLAANGMASGREPCLRGAKQTPGCSRAPRATGDRSAGELPGRRRPRRRATSLLLC